MEQQSPVVLVMAAGLGTRMKSERAKVLHELAGRPLVVWTVEAARAGGAGRVVVILGHQHEQVRAALDARYGAGAIDVALQPEQKGTGHAVLSALPALAAEPDDRVVVILSGDAPLLPAERVRELADAAAAASSGLALLSTRPSIPVPYGRLVRDGAGRLLRIVEDKDATPAERAITEVNAGFYGVRLGVLRADVARLRADNAQRELYLTDLAAHAAERGGAAVIEAPFDDVRGINDRVELAATDALARRRINERWMREGVSMQAPEQVFIDADAGPIERDVWLGPAVTLRGKTRVGAGARIEVGCFLVDTEIGPGTHLKPYSVLGETRVGAGARIGPFTHCRPGTQVDDDVHLGNFVEIKKSHLQAGAKANHLAYIGDASIGAKANIGAGTITCNYDGVMKYRTTIEAGAFIGSDSQLVAPVTVGRDAYVGSGTTVTKDVPRGGLGLARVKQVNIEGWADRFREAQRKRLQGKSGDGSGE